MSVGSPSLFLPLLPSDDHNTPTAILADVEAFASSLITGLPRGHTYHCIEHTRGVVENVRVIAASLSLTERNTALAVIAAWMHDVGFNVTYFGHEKESCKAARSFLSRFLKEKDIRAVESAILATRIPQVAENPISRVVCDADLLYLGGDQFSLWSGRLREEHLGVLDRVYTDLDWIDVNLEFMRGHRFFTEWVRKQYGEGLLRNFRGLEKMREALASRGALT